MKQQMIKESIINYLSIKKDLFDLYNKLENLEFPYDYRYIVLLDETSKLENKILESYSDQEIDLMIDILYKNINDLDFESKKNSNIFNKENDKKIYKKCLTEYNKRF